MRNKIYALCKAARKITEAELTELEGVAKQQRKIATPEFRQPGFRQPAIRSAGNNGITILRLVRELRDAVRSS